MTLSLQCSDMTECSNLLASRAQHALGIDLFGSHGSLSIWHKPDAHEITVTLREQVEHITTEDLVAAFLAPVSKPGSTIVEPGLLARAKRYLLGLFKKSN